MVVERVYWSLKIKRAGHILLLIVMAWTGIVAQDGTQGLLIDNLDLSIFILTTATQQLGLEFFIVSLKFFDLLR